MNFPPTRPLRIHKEILNNFFKAESIAKNLESEIRTAYGEEENFKRAHATLKLALLYLREARVLTEEQIRLEYPEAFSSK